MSFYPGTFEIGKLDREMLPVHPVANMVKETNIRTCYAMVYFWGKKTAAANIPSDFKNYAHEMSQMWTSRLHNFSPYERNTEYCV